MKRLILLRHAKTENWFQGSDDAGRALTARGHADSELIGAELMRLGWPANCTLVSSARRTRETWARIAPLMPEAALKISDDLYLASVHTIKQHIFDEWETDTLMLIGHNPGFYDLSMELAKSGQPNPAALEDLYIKALPTAAATLFEVEADRSIENSRFHLTHMLTAKTLRQSL